MHEPTIIELTSARASDAAKAQFWRRNILHLSRTELSRLVGYSVPAIQLFERGYDFKGRRIGDQAWLRYRLACAGLGVIFNWGVDNGEKAKPGLEEGRAGGPRDETRSAP